MLSEPHGECKPYGRPRSLTCDMVTPANAASSSNGTRVRLNGNTDCIKINVVLLISHGMCGKQYGEETKGQLSVRMYGHRDDWSQKRGGGLTVYEINTGFCPRTNFYDIMHIACWVHHHLISNIDFLLTT